MGIYRWGKKALCSFSGESSRGMLPTASWLFCVLFKAKMLTFTAGLERCHEKGRGGHLCGCTQKQQEWRVSSCLCINLCDKTIKDYYSCNIKINET